VPDSRARVWFALFVLAVFCLGGAGGFILAGHVPPFRRPPGPPPFGRIGGPAGMPPEAAGRLANEIGLDQGQREQLRTILDAHRRKFEQLHRDARDRFDDEQRELRDAIRAILRPDQAQRFDQYINGRRP